MDIIINYALFVIKPLVYLIGHHIKTEKRKTAPEIGN